MALDSRRVGRITASSAGAILGLAPYQKPADVMRRMVRDFHGAEKEFTGNPATEYGNYHEAGAIKELLMLHEVEFEKCGFFIHPKHDWLGATPDGIINGDTVLEVKCPYRLRNGGEHRPLAEQQHYYAQVQIQMLCTGLDRAIFYQWASHDDMVEAVNVDWAWLYANVPKLKTFHNQYLRELNNPAHLKPLNQSFDDPVLYAKTVRYEKLQEIIKEAKAEQEAILDHFKEITQHENAVICGHKLTKSTAKSTRYADAIKALLPDADLSEWQSESVRWRYT